MHSGDKSSILCSYLVHVLAQAQKNKNKSTQKKIPHISGNGTIYISRNRFPFPSHFLPPPTHPKIYIYIFLYFIFSPKKAFLIFPETKTTKKLLIFQELENPKKFLIFQEVTFQTPKIKISPLPPTHKKNPYISGNGTF